VEIGGALAEARTEAGLTIAQVSERTRIRETIIRGIEHDDYSACGGDYYARGHIRAIARVVGTDPVPLIAEYDAARMPPPEPADLPEPEPGHGWRLPGWHRVVGDGLEGLGFNGTIRNGNGHSADPAGPHDRGDPGLTAPAGPISFNDDADTDPGLADAGLLTSGADQPTGAQRTGAPRTGAPRTGLPLTGGLRTGSLRTGGLRSRFAGPEEPEGSGVPGGITAAEAFRPWMPLEPRRRLPRPTAALALILLAAIGGLIYLLVSGSSPASASHGSVGPGSAKHGSATHGSATHGRGAHKKTGSGAVAKHSAPPAVALTPVTATAFGPGGAGQGDNPQQAPLAIAGSASSGWQSDWYATADFAGLQSGTGLLLDMGKPVSVTSAQMLLGSQPGGTLELLAGDTPALADLQVVARAQLPGGEFTLPVSAPVNARYLLIWFTRLPPDTSGTYQASVSDIRLSGTT
jgi:hypothetical protein